MRARAMDLDQIFARNLELIRIAKGYTHENLALDADVSRSYFWSLQKGTSSATLEMVAKLAKALDVEPWHMLVPGLVVVSVSVEEAAADRVEMPLPVLRVAKTQSSKRKLRPAK